MVDKTDAVGIVKFFLTSEGKISCKLDFGFGELVPEELIEAIRNLQFGTLYFFNSDPQRLGEIGQVYREGMDYALASNEDGEDRDYYDPDDPDEPPPPPPTEVKKSMQHFEKFLKG